MKFSVFVCVFCAIFGALQAETLADGSKLIDRVSVYAVADPNGYVSKGFTFPPKGPAFSNYEITNIIQVNDGAPPSKVETTSGGIGSKHVSMIITSEYGKPIATTFGIYGKPLF